MNEEFENLWLCYSQAIVTFISHLTQKAKAILRHEVAVRVHGNRFSYNNISYPLHLVAFEHPKTLGYFNSELYEIGVNKIMMTVKDVTLLDNLLRHELAHYLTFIEYGTSIPTHGVEFRTLCRKMGWGKEVYEATTSISPHDTLLEESLTEKKIISKVEKLLALSSSANPYEAEQAAEKVHALLLKHNIQMVEESGLSSKKPMILKRLLKGKRSTAKLMAISDILHTFFVRPVINRGQNSVYLEILGEPTNVAIAEHVALFLDRELECLWKKTRKSHPHLKGLASKNSFFRGVSEGYCHKMLKNKEEQEKSNSNALITLEKQLEEATKLAYPSLSYRSTTFRHCEAASRHGFSEGGALQIQKTVKNSTRSNSPPSLTLQ